MSLSVAPYTIEVAGRTPELLALCLAVLRVRVLSAQLLQDGNARITTDTDAEEVTEACVAIDATVVKTAA